MKIPTDGRVLVTDVVASAANQSVDSARLHVTWYPMTGDARTVDCITAPVDAGFQLILAVIFVAVMTNR